MKNLLLIAAVATTAAFSGCAHQDHASYNAGLDPVAQGPDSQPAAPKPAATFNMDRSTLSY